MKKKWPSTSTAEELAVLLGLTPAEGTLMEFRSALSDKIIAIVKAKRLTHAQVAKLARTSRTRVTGLMNHSSADISTDLMLRILFSLGYNAKLTLAKAS